jgi:hypothetical protein
MIGKPWELKFFSGWKIREKIAYIYGYNSYVGVVPELKLGKKLMHELPEWEILWNFFLTSKSDRQTVNLFCMKAHF